MGQCVKCQRVGKPSANLMLPSILKRRLQGENMRKPSATVQHIQKLLRIYHKKYFEKLTANSKLRDIAPLMIKLLIPSIRLTKLAKIKTTLGQLIKISGTKNQTKKTITRVFSCSLRFFMTRFFLLKYSPTKILFSY